MSFIPQAKITQILTAFLLEQLPKPPPPLKHVLLAGKSNVGKSSLINALFQQKKLAKVSKTPGKTVSINYYFTDQQTVLIDLPGYGYAQRSKKEVGQWQYFLEGFLRQVPPHSELLLLVDSRRGIQKEDLEALEYFQFFGIKVTILLTKADKLNNRARSKLQSTTKVAALLFSIHMPELIQEVYETIFTPH